MARPKGVGLTEAGLRPDGATQWHQVELSGGHVAAILRTRACPRKPKGDFPSERRLQSAGTFDNGLITLQKAECETRLDISAEWSLRSGGAGLFRSAQPRELEDVLHRDSLPEPLLSLS